MNLPEKISSILNRQGGMILARQIASAGISRQMVQHYVKAGLLNREAFGVYTCPDGSVDDFLMLALKVPEGILSHGTALYLNGITDRTPFGLSMTISSDSVLTSSLRGSVTCFYVSDELLNMGRITLKTPFGNEVATYDCERTICDMIRSRKRLDDELVLDGIRQYAARKDKEIDRLGWYARQLGVLEDIRRTMEVVL